MPSLSMTADRVISKKKAKPTNTTVCSTSPVTLCIYFGNSHLAPVYFDRETLVMTNGSRWYTFELYRHQAIIAHTMLWKIQ